MAEKLRGQDLKLSYEAMSVFGDMPSNPNAFAALSAGKFLISGRWILRQVSFVNNTAAAVVLSCYDGQDATGQMVGVVSAAAGLTGEMSFGPRGVLLEMGLFISPSAGPVSGSALAVPLWTYNITPPSN